MNTRLNLREFACNLFFSLFLVNIFKFKKSFEIIHSSSFQQFFFFFFFFFLQSNKMLRSVVLRSSLTARRVCDTRLRRIRNKNSKSDNMSMLELVTASISDNNSSNTPSRRSDEQNLKEAINALKNNLPNGDDILIPSYGHIDSVRNVFRGAWLPEDFSSVAEKRLNSVFNIKDSNGVISVLPMVDKSFHETSNNEAIAKVGEAIIHLYTRRVGLEIQNEYPEKYLRTGIELASDGNLSRILRGYLPISKNILTDLETAHLLDGLCYYGKVLGSGTIAHYPFKEKVEKTQETSKESKIRVYSTCLKAVVGSVYLENGIDSAVEFIEKYICPKLKKILEGEIK